MRLTRFRLLRTSFHLVVVKKPDLKSLRKNIFFLGTFKIITKSVLFSPNLLSECTIKKMQMTGELPTGVIINSLNRELFVTAVKISYKKLCEDVYRELG